MPMRWTVSAQAVDEAAASGYQRDTGVEVTMSFAGPLQRMRPDPAECNGTTCRNGEHTFPQASCPHFIRAPVTVTFATADGALRGTVQGEAAQWHTGFESQIGDTADRVIVQA